MHQASTRKSILKACDGCRRRKIKCNGLQPCPGCLSAGIICTYDAPRGQGGNRGSRATVLNELRSRPQSHEAQVHSHTPQLNSLSPDTHRLNSTSQVISDSNIVHTCIHIYESRVYPVIPLLDVAIIKAQVNQANNSPISHQFTKAFCAYVSTFGTLFGDSENESARFLNSSSSCQLLETAMSAYDPRNVAQPTPVSVYTSFFLYGAWASQGDYQKAWYYLRETTTLFIMVNIESAAWYDQKAQRCLFWILVVSERSHAIRRSRPITISVLSSSPSLKSVDERGLQYLASLFKPLNEIFFAIWNGVTQECSKEWLLQLEYEVRSALPLTLEVSDEEAANLRISQLWLQIKLWELFPRFGFLSSESVYECLTFQYPVAVARSFVNSATALSVSNLHVHGVGMTEKVFDIACALADVLPFTSLTSDNNAVEYLTRMSSLLMQLPGGSSKFVPLLFAKVNELFPDLAKTLCDAIELPLGIFDDPMSPKTRFIYEDEVGRGLYTDLRRAI
ncbi:hypothetical protein GQ44DRAFT_663959 [Phaeosphaeriaceae sp. PMI808]|nr:hypothetical protein GQ44DRAFT_663959 [Phaeosphaeriaceae sp. PMI808]